MDRQRAALAVSCARGLILADNRHPIYRIRQVLEIVLYRLLELV